jgi:glycosyltransferase involved in cell wall biosynthesis
MERPASIGQLLRWPLEAVLRRLIRYPRALLVEDLHARVLIAERLHAYELTSPELDALRGEVRALGGELASVRQVIDYLGRPDRPEPARTAMRTAGGFIAPGAVRALHVGNIANNSYLSARILNAAGFDCDVLCYNYYHIMGSPEWEDADFVGEVTDPVHPDWDAVDVRGFRRPRWFAQGLLEPAIRYLVARRRGDLAQAARISGAIDRAPRAPETAPRPQPFLSSLIAAFDRAFPDRADRLTEADAAWFLDAYGVDLGEMQGLFDHYDVVTGFATDGIWPLLAGHRPYIAFEHGTIRSLPFDDTPLSRLTALAYHEADAVVVTNADNLGAAKRLGARDIRFVPHPVNERWILPGIGAELGARLRADLGADFVIFHPSRHHWEPAERHPSWEKGNDIFIEGFARFVAETAPRAAAVFVDWGKTATESRRLLAHRGVDHRVIWIPPQHNCNMSRYVDASDVVADQFFLGSFGNIMPKALAAGRPSILFLDESVHEWAFPEPPPVINARTPEAVFQGLSRAYHDPSWREELSRRGREWYLRYHSNAVIGDKLATLYRDVLERAGRTVEGGA